MTYNIYRNGEICQSSIYRPKSITALDKMMATPLITMNTLYGINPSEHNAYHPRNGITWILEVLEQWKPMTWSLHPLWRNSLQPRYHKHEYKLDCGYHSRDITKLSVISTQDP